MFSAIKNLGVEWATFFTLFLGIPTEQNRVIDYRIEMVHP